MLANNLWKQFIQPIESGDLEELRRGTLFEIGVVMFLVVWIIMIGSYGNPEELLIAFILLGCSVGSIWLRQVDFRLAVAGLIATSVAAIACQKLLFPASPAQYFFPVIVVTSSLLVSSVNVFVVALIASATILAVSQLQEISWGNSQQVVAPIFLTLLTACATWIGSRQIRLALDWMHNSYAHASDLLEQLRDERASLARALKMLGNAYVRIEKMNYALIEARSTAENARQLKAEFAANISHELRTPLNLIIGFSETMANAPETYRGVAWSPELRGDIEQIYRSSRHLASLIDDILDLSALDARRLGLALQDAAIDDPIAEAIAVVQDLFRAKNLYLKVDIEPGLPRVRIDPTRIRQVFINLLTNASRFTHTGGVTITVRWIEDAVRAAIQDTGIGIAPEDVSKVFEEFGQVDGSTTRKHEGTGLGVPLSKRLVESQGGQMWLESQPGAGTTFCFTLPSSQTMPASPTFRTSPRAAVPTYRKSVLVFAPDLALLQTVRRHLTGYDVIQVMEGDDFSALVERHQPIVLIVNAQEADQRIWQVPDDLPVIHVAMTGNLRAAQSLGAQNYLIKPVLREQLLDAIVSLERETSQVLIVDDDPEFVELMARMLQSAGETYHPVKAFGGIDALARLRSERIDLVLLDLLMPGVDGVTVLKEMKNDPALAEMPVIVISAQHPDIVESGLFLQLARAASASTPETLNYLQALLDTLPLRGLPATVGAPALPPVPADQSVS